MKNLKSFIYYFMWLEQGIINITDEQIEEQVKEYISKYKDDICEKEECDIFDNPTGLGYLAEDNELFKKITKYIDKAIKEIKKEQIQKEKNDDINNFIKELKKLNKKNVFQIVKSYERVSFFDGFTEEKIDELVNLPANSLFVFNHVINYRYSDNNYVNNKKQYCFYISEMDFLKKLKEKLSKEAKEIKSLRKVAIGYLLNNIQDAIIKLEKCKNESS